MKLFKVVATSAPLNFIPGTLNPADENCRLVTESPAMPLLSAERMRAEWVREVRSPGWKIEIVPTESGGR